MSTESATTPKIQIRWMIRRDVPSVLQIDRDSFSRPWGEDRLMEFMRQRNCIGLVAESISSDKSQGNKSQCDKCQSDQILGFVVYELHKEHYLISRLAVAPDHRRSGIGSRIIQKMIAKLSPENQANAGSNRSQIEILVRETNLNAQFFLAKQQFIAMSVLRGFFSGDGGDGDMDDTGEDAYLMLYRREWGE